MTSLLISCQHFHRFQLAIFKKICCHLFSQYEYHVLGLCNNKSYTLHIHSYLASEKLEFQDRPAVKSTYSGKVTMVPPEGHGLSLMFCEDLFFVTYVCVCVCLCKCMHVCVCVHAHAHAHALTNTLMYAEAWRMFLFCYSPPIALRQNLFLNLEPVSQLCWRPVNTSSPLSVS